MMVMTMMMMTMMTMLEHRFEERWLIPDDSYLAKFWDDQKEFFKQGGERGTIYFADFNLTNNQLERITQLVKNLKNETEIISEVDQWAVEFSERFHNGSLKEDPGVHLVGMVQGQINNDPMIKKLGQFLKSKEGLHYRDRFVFENNAKPSCVESDLPALVMFKIQFQHPLFSGLLYQLRDLFLLTQISWMKPMRWNLSWTSSLRSN